MGLSGSQVAYRQARADIARADTTRADYYWPQPIVIIGGSPVTKVQLSARITKYLNEQPSEASVIYRSASAPTVGSTIVIALGADQTSKRLFAGHIAQVTRIQGRTGEKVSYLLTCVDYMRHLDRRLVTYFWGAASASTIVSELISAYCDGFTAYHVQAELATIEGVSAVNEYPSAILRKVAALIGAQFYIDGAKDLHFYLTEPYASTPLAVTTATTHFWDPEISRDVTQVRTRVCVEGKSASIPVIGIPAGAETIPLDDDSAFNAILPADGGGFTYDAFARIGTQRITYTGLSGVTVIGTNPAGGTITEDVAIGATSVKVTDLLWLGPNAPPGWARAEDQVFRFTSMDTGTPKQLTGIPASGYGSIQAPITLDTGVHMLGSLEGIPALGAANSIRVEQQPGTSVTVGVQVDDTTAQTAFAAVEGSNGIHEFGVQDGNLDIDGMVQHALSSLELNGAVQLVSYWTRDKAAEPGRLVSVDLGGVQATIPIQSVEITLEQMVTPSGTTVRTLPIRKVTVSPFKLPTILTDMPRHGGGPL